MLALAIIVSAVFGLIIGSFLNVVIYRVPAGLSVVRPPSACPGCGSPVLPRDNIPVVSWLLLKGRCRACGAPISPRYPLIEGLTAAVFAVIAARLGADWILPAELLFAAGLIALAAVDVERFLIPRAILYPTSVLVAAGLVVASGFDDRWSRLWVAAACAAAAFGVFFLINFIRPAWMGFGDVRLAGLMGLALGWLGPWFVVIAFMVGNLAGALVGVVLMVAGKANRRTALPYGLFLSAGSILAILIGHPIIHWYSSRIVH